MLKLNLMTNYIWYDYSLGVKKNPGFSINKKIIVKDDIDMQSKGSKGKISLGLKEV